MLPPSTLNLKSNLSYPNINILCCRISEKDLQEKISLIKLTIGSGKLIHKYLETLMTESAIANGILPHEIRQLAAINVSDPEAMSLAETLVQLANDNVEEGHLNIGIYQNPRTEDFIAELQTNTGLAISILVRDGFLQREIFNVAKAIDARVAGTISDFMENNDVITSIFEIEADN